jgi:hypothetical protein
MTFLLLLLLPLEARAFLPPAFYVYTHIAEQRGRTPPPGAPNVRCQAFGVGH